MVLRGIGGRCRSRRRGLVRTRRQLLLLRMVRLLGILSLRGRRGHAGGGAGGNGCHPVGGRGRAIVGSPLGQWGGHAVRGVGMSVAGRRVLLLLRCWRGHAVAIASRWRGSRWLRLAGPVRDLNAPSWKIAGSDGSAGAAGSSRVSGRRIEVFQSIGQCRFRTASSHIWRWDRSRQRSCIRRWIERCISADTWGGRDKLAVVVVAVVRIEPTSHEDVFHVSCHV
jgi:hypothetical protein